MVQKTSKSDDQ